MIALFHLKTGFWSRLPWVLAGLAHADEAVARTIAQEALLQFEKDGRKDSHHRITWFWMQPGLLRNQLGQFANGARLEEIGAPLYGEIAKLRFIFVVETCIEAKHANVAKALNHRVLGFPRISLSNRMQLLERWLARQHVQVSDLLDKFQHARSLGRVVKTLKLDRHPCVLKDLNML